MSPDEKRLKLRLQQRFENYQKILALLEDTSRQNLKNDAIRGGLIHFFELTFELGWKVMKDYLATVGYQTKGPRDTIKYALRTSLISDGETWLDALNDRNQATHTYDETTTNKIENEILKNYLTLFQQLKNKLLEESQQS